VGQGQFLVLTIYNGSNTNIIGASFNRGSSTYFDSTSAHRCSAYTEDLDCGTNRCNYTLVFPTCYFAVSSGNYYFFLNNPLNDSGVSFVLNSQSTSQDSSTLLAENVTISGTVPSSGHSYLTFDNIPPSIIKISNTLGTGLNRITVRLQDTDSVNCLDTGGAVFPTQTLSLRVICPQSGVIVMSGTNIPFTAIRNPLKTESFSDQKLALGPFSNEQGGTSAVGSFSISPKSAISWTVTTTDPSVRLRLEIYPKGSCQSIYTQTCAVNAYPCYFVNTLELEGDYNLVVRDNQNIPNPTPSNYNFTVSYIYGNNQCRNITNELGDFCRGNLSTSDSYQLTTAQVLTTEQSARFAYYTLALSWSVDDCNASLVEFACKSSFQPYLCTSSGALTTTYYCNQECIDTLKPKCLSSGDPNFCELGACKTVSNSITKCITNPPNDKGDSGRLIVTLLFTLLSSYLLRMFN